MRILIADDDEMSRELLRFTLESDGHEVLLAADGLEAISVLEGGAAQCVVTDWEMPNLDGPGLCAAVRAGDYGSYVYLIMLTARNVDRGAADGLNCGADDFLLKPFDRAELLARVRVAERILSLETRDLMIFALAKLAESRDPETGAHLERVQEYARVLARDLLDRQQPGYDVDPSFVNLIYRTSPLHDVGKVAVPDAVLLKPGRLTDEEMGVMRTHTTHGAETLRAAASRCPGADFLQMAIQIAESHHEKLDGTGYPHGLRGTDIPLAARVTAVADVYDALTSRRVYKPAFDHAKARDIIVKDAGTHFDPVLVESFLRHESEFVDIARRYGEPEENPNESDGHPGDEFRNAARRDLPTRAAA